jgi:uncharacterized membrane protein YjdF
VVLVGAVLYAAVLERSVGLLINTSGPLVLGLVPLYVRLRHGYRLNAVLVLIVGGGAAFHSVGSLGLYRSIGWFDQLAHAVAGVLVGGVGYALVQVVDTQHERVDIPPNLRFVFVLVFAVSIGVTWEIAEFALGLLSESFGGEALLAQYGLRDVVLDLQFDVVGALVVAVWGTSYFDGLRTVLTSVLTPAER